MIGPVDAASTPWAFTQSGPLRTRQFARHLRDRGLPQRPKQLATLYRNGHLVPFLQVTDVPVRSPIEVSSTPRMAGATLVGLHRALAEGRIRDLAAEAYDPTVRFDDRKVSDPSRWWNGLIYSPWQALVIPELERVDLDGADQPSIASSRIAGWVPVLTALEPRYLPTLDPEWLSLSNAEEGEWNEFAATFDRMATLERLEAEPADYVQVAEWLLTRARNLDPTGAWSQLIRRAPRAAWKSLRNDALLAMDHRIAAEILLRFYEDLVDVDAAPVLPPPSPSWWTPRAERLSYYSEEHLDRVLSGLGVSPHPGAVVFVEGETEELVFRHVFDHFGWRRTPDRIQLVNRRGANDKLALVGSTIAAPLLGDLRDGTYDLIRPPTRLLIVVDPDPGWDTDEKAERQRQKILQRIQGVIKSQGAQLSEDDLGSLVVVRRWSQRCFEFAHYSDRELSEALGRHPGAPRQTRLVDLQDRLADARARGLDVKAAYHEWEPLPSKPQLAEQMWPLLRAKIEDARWDHSQPIPEVVEVAYEAFQLAQRPPTGTFVLDAEAEPTEDR